MRGPGESYSDVILRWRKGTVEIPRLLGMPQDEASAIPNLETVEWASTTLLEWNIGPHDRVLVRKTGRQRLDARDTPIK
jgi:hypothetical protein